MEAEGEELPVGFPGLLKGTDKVGAALITDRGFCRDVAQKYMKLGVLSPREWCVKHDIPFLWPFTADDEYGLIYDAVIGRLHLVDKEDAKVGYHTYKTYNWFSLCRARLLTGRDT